MLDPSTPVCVSLRSLLDQEVWLVSIGHVIAIGNFSTLQKHAHASIIKCCKKFCPNVPTFERTIHVNNKVDQHSWQSNQQPSSHYCLVIIQIQSLPITSRILAC